MSPPANNYGRDVLDDLPHGGVLIAVVLVAVAAVAAIPLACGAVLYGLIRLVGGGRRVLLAVGLFAGAAILARGAETAALDYWSAGPLWRVGPAVEAFGALGFVGLILPLTLGIGVVVCGVLMTWLDIRRPFWVEDRRRPTVAERRRRRRERDAVRRGETAVGGIALGERDDGQVICVRPEDLRQHALVLGATGAGKTTTLGTLIDGVCQSGAGLCIVDLKGDPELIDTLSLIAAANGQAFRLWRVGGDERWNPLARGDETELMNKLVELEEWSEPHYKRGAQRYLQTLLGVIAAVGEARDLSAVARHMAPTQFRKLVTEAEKSGRIEPEEATPVFEYLDDLDSSSASAVQGLANRLALLAESTAAEELRGGAGAIDIGEGLDRGELILFSLDSSKYVETASQLAALVCRDLITVCGERIGRRHGGERLRPGFLVIDEFSAMRTDQLAALIARSARSAELGVVLATQELADLSRIDPGFCDQVIGNTQIKIVHRQDVPESAERLANVAGTESAWHETFRTERDPVHSLGGRHIGGRFGRQLGEGTISRGERFRIHPNALKALGRGRAVVMRKLPELQVDTIAVRALDSQSLEERAAESRVRPTLEEAA